MHLLAGNKGLGFGDEGIYLQAAAYPEEIRENVSTIFTFTGALLRLGGGDVPMFRLLGLRYRIRACSGFRLQGLSGPGISDRQGLWSALLVCPCRCTTALSMVLSDLSYYTFSAVAVNLACGVAWLSPPFRQAARLPAGYGGSNSYGSPPFATLGQAEVSSWPVLNMLPL